MSVSVHMNVDDVMHVTLLLTTWMMSLVWTRLRAGSTSPNMQMSPEASVMSPNVTSRVVPVLNPAPSASVNGPESPSPVITTACM